MSIHLSQSFLPDVPQFVKFATNSQICLDIADAYVHNKMQLCCILQIEGE